MPEPVPLPEVGGEAAARDAARGRHILLGDRAFCSYAHVVLLDAAGVFACFRLHQRRKTARARGTERWRRPKRPPVWMTPQQWLQLPARIDVRLVRYTIVARGRRTRHVVPFFSGGLSYRSSISTYTDADRSVTTPAQKEVTVTSNGFSMDCGTLARRSRTETSMSSASGDKATETYGNRQFSRCRASKPIKTDQNRSPGRRDDAGNSPHRRPIGRDRPDTDNRAEGRR